MKKNILLILLLFVVSLLTANDTTKIQFVDPPEYELKFIETPSILYNNYIKINIPEGFSLLDKESSKYASENYYNNEPDPNLLGILVKYDANDEIDYLIYIMENKEGYVKDEDASKIDKDDILKEQQANEIEYYKANPQVKNKLYFQKWGIDPKYDQSSHTLHFAKLFSYDDTEDLILNYQLFKLNKYGYINITVAADSAQLAQVIADIPSLYEIVQYENESSYSDFDPSTGNFAQWTVGGLVAGKILAKTGILALLLKNIKFVIIGIVAAFYGITKFFKKKKQKEEAFSDPENN